MQCPSGHRVPGGAKFCPECGVPLAAERCPDCDALITAGARFCAGCGAPVTQVTPGRRKEDRAPRREEELRQITAVFCDMVGSTELSARLDPEDYGELTMDYQERVGEVLERYGGAVIQYQGDGILMHFGWPLAHDDDAERAVLASLAIVEELASPTGPYPLQVRIGVHTGQVLVGEVGSAGGTETLALGETMNRAARLQGCAEPGAVVISDSTLHLVRGIFVVEDLGPQELKGIAEPVTAYRVLQRSGVRSKLDAAGDRLTPLVSRDQDLARMLERWELARAGDGQSLLLTGDPGIGKSRLVYELRQRLTGGDHSWLEARGSSYTEHTAFEPAIQLIEQALEIDRGEGPEDRLAKLEAGLGLVGVDDPDALAVLAQLLSIDGDAPRVVMSPELTRRRTTELLAKWVLALAELQPLILLVEDLHWCDSASLDLFEQLMVQGSRATLMLVGTSRPELEVGWRGHPNLQTIELQPLGDVETRELLRCLSPGRSLPEPVLHRVVEETDGIPLFAEEMGRMVLDSGLLSEQDGELALTAPLDELDIPATLQDSLMARLDRLSAAKRVAQLAATIGREFDYRLLEEVSGLEPGMLGHGLRRLVEDELIFQDGEPPDATYTFKHALIQDAAYRSLLRRSRRPLHERTAEALERRGDAVSPEVLARHWEAAERPVEAIDQYALAAEAAARHSAHSEAIEHLRKALGLIDSLPEGAERKALEVDLQTALGSSIMALRGYADPEIETAYTRARSLCSELGQGSRVGYALVGLAIFYFNSGQVRLGADLAGDALRIADAEEDDALQLLARVQLAVPSLWAGDFVAALEHADAAAAIYDRERHGDLAFRFGTDQGVSAHCMAACALACHGFPDRGLARVHEAVELARVIGHPFNVVYALAIECGIRWIRGELEAQETLADEVVAISEQNGFSDFLGIGRILRGTALGARSADPAGLEDCLAGLTLATSTGRRGSGTMFLELIGAAHHAQGRTEEALGWVEGGLSLGEETGQHWWDARLLRLRGELRLSANGGPEAEADFRRGLEVARELGDRLSELRCAISLAQLLRERGDAEAPERLVRPIYSQLSEGGETRAAIDAAVLLEESRPAPSRP